MQLQSSHTANDMLRAQCNCYHKLSKCAQISHAYSLCLVLLQHYESRDTLLADAKAVETFTALSPLHVATSDWPTTSSNYTIAMKADNSCCAVWIRSQCVQRTTICAALRRASYVGCLLYHYFSLLMMASW
jgi:hypothetical protein